MKDRNGIYLFVILALAIIFWVYIGLSGDSETTGQRQAREAYEREQAAELEERLQKAYDNGRADGYAAAESDYDWRSDISQSDIDDLRSVIAEAAERANKISVMLEEPDEYTLDDVYKAVEDLRTYLWDNY